MKKTRQDIIRESILAFDADVELLEIGVDYGDTWHEQRAHLTNYTGVDINLTRARASICMNDPRCHWFEMTSAEFWKMIDQQPLSYLCRDAKTWNLIFIDGDHGYEVVRNDIENALKHLESRGYLLVHDAASDQVFRAYKESCLSRSDLECAYLGPDIHRCGICVCRRKT